MLPLPSLLKSSATSPRLKLQNRRSSLAPPLPLAPHPSCCQTPPHLLLGYLQAVLFCPPCCHRTPFHPDDASPAFLPASHHSATVLSHCVWFPFSSNSPTIPMPCRCHLKARVTAVVPLPFILAFWTILISKGGNTEINKNKKTKNKCRRPWDLTRRGGCRTQTTQWPSAGLLATRVTWAGPPHPGGCQTPSWHVALGVRPLGSSLATGAQLPKVWNSHF